MGAGSFQYRSAERGKGSGVGSNFCLNTLYNSLFIAPHGKVHNKVMTFRMNEQRLFSCQPGFCRSSCKISDQSRIWLHCHILFAAESAADQSIFRTNLIRSKHKTALMIGTVGRLICRNNMDIVILVHIGHRTFRFKEGVFCPRRLKMFGNDMGRILNRFRCIAPAHMLMRLNIGCFFIKYKRCALGGCFFNIMNRRQYLVFYFNQSFCLFGCLHILSSHKSNRISQIMGQPPNRNKGILVMF